MGMAVGERGGMMITKLRAWDKETKIMLVVNNICNLFWDSKFIEGYELVPDPKGKHEYELIDHRIDLDDAIIMESTGLFDISTPQKEIFEGDIVIFTMRFGKRSTKSIGVVTFDKNELCFRVRNNIGGHYITFLHSRYLEVIGNIYENPELLEEVEDDT